MKQLEQLEQRIARVIAHTKELEKENKELKARNAELTARQDQLQASVMKENSAAATLASEKDAIKTSIEEMLASIDSLEATE